MKIELLDGTTENPRFWKIETISSVVEVKG